MYITDQRREAERLILRFSERESLEDAKAIAIAITYCNEMIETLLGVAGRLDELGVNFDYNDFLYKVKDELELIQKSNADKTGNTVQ